LRHLIEQARDINMPQDNITRAIKRGTGELPGVNYESYTYEGYGPFGIAVMVETLSDNKNRTVADMRHIFSKGKGNLGESGSVSWMFKRMGVVRGTGTMSEDQLLEALLEYDIADLKHDGTFFSIFVEPSSLDAIKKAAQNAGLHVDSANIEWVAQSTIPLADEQTEKAVEFLSMLQDHEDVQNVYTNLA
jgi:YebC/PmpR family DNA-binding regulatory protein